MLFYIFNHDELGSNQTASILQPSPEYTIDNNSEEHGVIIQREEAFKNIRRKTSQLTNDPPIVSLIAL